MPLSALVDLRNEFAVAAGNRARLIRLFAGHAALSGDDPAKVAFMIGEHRTYTEVIQALDALVAVQTLDEELVDLTALDGDPNIDRLEDL
jgi:hypothetical protein